MSTKESTDLLSTIESKASELQARGGEIEETGRIPEDILEWVYDHQLFKIMVPKEFGGRPTSLPDALRIFEALSAIDGSLGWLVHIGAAGGFFAPSFEKETARSFFSPREAVIAGSGFPSGQAHPVEGGYMVSGRWLYASGAQYASLFTAGATIEEKGEKTIRAFAFFPDQVKVTNDWSAFGLKGTASDTFEVHKAFVPHERVFNVGESKWYVSDPIARCLYRLPFDILAVTTIASVCMGLTRRFFELAQSMPRWERLGRKTLLADEAIEHRHLFYLLADRAWSQIVLGEDLEKEEQRTIIQGIRRLVEESVSKVQHTFAYLGMRALMQSEPINRVYRDLQTASQHTYLRQPVH